MWLTSFRHDNPCFHERSLYCWDCSYSIKTTFVETRTIMPKGGQSHDWFLHILRSIYRFNWLDYHSILVRSKRRTCTRKRVNQNAWIRFIIQAFFWVPSYFFDLSCEYCPLAVGFRPFNLIFRPLATSYGPFNLGFRPLMNHFVHSLGGGHQSSGKRHRLY